MYIHCMEEVFNMVLFTTGVWNFIVSYIEEFLMIVMYWSGLLMEQS